VIKSGGAEITANLDLGAQAENFERLCKLADEILADAKLRNKAGLRPVFLAALRLREVGKEAAALRYLLGGLERDPWALARQLDAAELLQRAGKQAEAEHRIRLVLDHAESDVDYGRALLLQGKPRNSRLPPLAKFTGDGHAVVLVPAGPVDTFLLQEVRDDLAKMLAIPVLAREAGLQLPPPTRDGLADFEERLREELFRGLDPLEYLCTLRDLALTTNDLRDLPTARRFAGLLSERLLDWPTGNRMSYWAESNKSRQWDIGAMLTALRETVKPLVNPRVGYLAVTRKDLYDQGYNYLFGSAKPQFAVMSYHRFRGDFNGEEPDRARLRKRMRNQCISSIGLLFEIPRCQEPACPRCYPNSLEEHDRKGSELCPLCRKRFMDKFGVEGKPLEEQPPAAGVDQF
jgi:predicted Zn-dependent protease